MRNKLVIGSRGSRLALWQTNFIKERLQPFLPETEFEIKIIKTTGDKLLDVALSKIGDKGLFTRQIETALLDGEIDFAVHSLKDLQTVQPEGLKIGAVTAREIPNDVFISQKYDSIDALPAGAKAATGSLRRRSQLLNLRPDLLVSEIRGNVPTRIEKFLKSDADALILAFAGVHRLGLDAFIKQVIPLDVMLPAVGQGALGIEIRGEDAEIEAMLEKINDEPTALCTAAERSFLRRLEGGCQVPIAGYAQLDGDKIHLKGLAGSADGSIVLKDSIIGDKHEAVNLGKRLAETLIEKGAGELLEAVRQEVENTKEAVI